VGRAALSRRAGSPAIEPTFFSRYECKYLVDPALVPEIRHYLRPFVRPDEFAALCAGHRYPICSLYLDSQDLLLYQQTVSGEKDRFKLRVRTYSDDPASPAFLEVKSKRNSVVHKRRAGVDRDVARDLLADRFGDSRGLDAQARDDMDFFRHHARLIGARPIARVKYVREAYQATGNEPVRITVDTDLMHAVTLHDALSHESGRWTRTPLDGVIIEIKFTERYPWWVQQFVRTFGLKQQAVPKYVLSLDHLLLEGRESALTVAGVTLPPRGA
jgi:hypothetical protein